MNKSELVSEIASRAEVSKNVAQKVLDSFTSTVTDTLVSGDSIVIVGFGSFVTRERAKREGRNPQTGKKIQIPASTIPAFKAGKSLKDAVNN